MAKLTFDEATHKYKNDGKVKPSVTQIIGDVLKGEREEMEPSDAIIKGTIIHKTLEYLDKGVLGEYDSRIQSYVDAWNKFKSDYKVEFLSIEEFRIDPTEQFAGRIDRVAVIDGKTTVIDIKSGKSYKEYTTQTAGYALLYDNLIERRMCVFFDENGYKVEEHTNPQDLEVFKALLLVWKFKKGKL